MKTIYLSVLIISFNAILLNAQQDQVSNTTYQNSADVMLSNDSKLGIGGYGEVHFNQPLNKNQRDLGTLDVHRMVLFVGYNFSSKTQFVSEIEFEYAKELWVEQAFIQHKLGKSVNLRAGLMLVPMGIINEYHEPTTFNGVERPTIDNKLSLSTWREVGIGVTGNILPASMKYQLYMVNGLNGYDTKGIFNGSSGLREGRQKGSKAFSSSPNFTGKVEYYGIKNLNFGLSGYVGKSQSRLFNKLQDDDTLNEVKADSSVVGIAMLGMDARYNIKNFELRGQFYYASLNNTEEYNEFTGNMLKNNDLGQAMMGYYVEAGYNVLKSFSQIKEELIPFVRYEYYNTHHKVSEQTAKNAAYENTIITSGLTFKLNKNAVLKTDVQWAKNAATSTYSKTFNAGIGFMF